MMEIWSRVFAYDSFVEGFVFLESFVSCISDHRNLAKHFNSSVHLKRLYGHRPNTVVWVWIWPRAQWWCQMVGSHLCWSDQQVSDIPDRRIDKANFFLLFVLKELLPLVLMFELPVIVQLNPDPSSPAIQHISQTYNISVAFRQRSRLYGTTGVVRGSQNNIAAVKVCTTHIFIDCE